MRNMETRRQRLVLTVACAAFMTMSILTGCELIDADEESNAEEAADSTEVVDTDQEESTSAHWTYHGEEGPEHWGELDPAYAACGEGESQSPIDFASTTEQDLANIQFSYESSAVKIINNGHTILVEYDAGSSISVDDKRYDLKQFHFHAPSEHSSDGVEHAAELHLVHAAEDDSLAVVGLFVDIGPENTSLAEVWEHLPEESGPARSTDAIVDAADLLPPDQRTFRYSGSLTTPPCSEDVDWLMMIEPINISDAQLAAFTEIMEGNDRPVQPLNDREVREDTSP